MNKLDKRKATIENVRLRLFDVANFNISNIIHDEVVDFAKALGQGCGVDVARWMEEAAADWIAKGTVAPYRTPGGAMVEPRSLARIVADPELDKLALGMVMPNAGGFDGVKPGDWVQDGGQLGILIDAMQDGDAVVLYQHDRRVHTTKWAHLRRYGLPAEK